VVEKTLHGKSPAQFTIVEVKSGTSQMAPNEMQLQQKCVNQGIDYALSRISAIDDSPMEWDLVQEI
jgi:hypothetical protein